MDHAIFFNPPLNSNFLAHQLDEIYKEKIYAPILNGRKGLTIVDIGGNIGMTSYYFSQFADRVITLEPSKEHVEILNKMLNYNKIDNVKVRQEALYIENGQFPLHKSSVNKTMYSLYSTVGDKKIPPEQVKTITIDKLFEEEKIDKCALLKLDVEGSEGEIVCSPSFTKVAPFIDTITCELHSWADRNLNQLQHALKKLGFKIEKLDTNADLIIGRK